MIRCNMNDLKKHISIYHPLEIKYQTKKPDSLAHLLTKINS